MATSQVLTRFSIASLFMWALPLVVLFIFNHNLLPGLADMSPQSHTIWSGCLAVVSVNVVILFYIFLALREPPSAPAGPAPDADFLQRARQSLSSNTASSELHDDKKSD